MAQIRLDYRDAKKLKSCKGCRLIQKDNYCIIIDYNTHNDCPCVECLVKVTCKQQGQCDLRYVYMNNSVYPDRLHYRRNDDS